MIKLTNSNELNLSNKMSDNDTYKNFKNKLIYIAIIFTLGFTSCFIVFMTLNIDFKDLRYTDQDNAGSAINSLVKNISEDVKTKENLLALEEAYQKLEISFKLLQSEHSKLEDRYQDLEVFNKELKTKVDVLNKECYKLNRQKNFSLVN